MDALLQDIRYGIRQLRKSPGFAVLAILTLALGIGANTAMFTVVESVLLRPLLYANADRLVSIGLEGARGGDDRPTSTSYLNYRDIRDQSQTLAAVAGYSEDVGVVQGHDGSMSVLTPGVSTNLFPMLGAKPLLGRTFTEDEGKAGGPRVAILSEGLWRQGFSADPQIIGRTIRVNAQPRVVVGVMPRGFQFPESTGPDLNKGLWLPIQPTKEMLTERGYSFFLVIGQLKPGATVAQLRSEFTTIAKRIHQSDPKATRDIPFTAEPYQRLVTGDVRGVLIALLVGFGPGIAHCVRQRGQFADRTLSGTAAGICGTRRTRGRTPAASPPTCG